MRTNATNVTQKLIYPELSYLLTGIFFEIHNSLGRYSREKQYGDKLATKLTQLQIPYKREYVIKGTGNIVDFLIADKIVIELKAKPVTTKEDYYQMQRYLQVLGIKLGLLVNFRYRYLKPIRVVRIDTEIRKKFV